MFIRIEGVPVLLSGTVLTRLLLTQEVLDMTVGHVRLSPVETNIEPTCREGVVRISTTIWTLILDQDPLISNSVNPVAVCFILATSRLVTSTD